MPIYEYNCPACGAEFEALVPHAQADEVCCEVCGAATERLVSCCFGSVDKGSETSAAGCTSGG